MRWRSILPVLALAALGGLVGCAGTAPAGGASGAGGGGSSPAVLPWSSNGGKIAYVRSDVISQRLADYRDADNTLKSENSQWLSDASKMEADIHTKEAELDELRLILTPERRKDLEDALDKARKDLQKYRQDTWYDEESKYIKRRKELMEPVDAKVNDAIYKVAEAQGLDIVLDTVAGNVVYAKPGLDLTDKVLEELQK
jgi:outer membrane protein